MAKQTRTKKEQTSDDPRPAKGSTAAAVSAPAATPPEAGYVVLARRYRSRGFDELVGQEAIAQTLRNAIAHNRVAHAYLFTGTRGVGKTSTARIFAKELNAVAGLTERDAIAAAILRGDDMDVIEIDGASNRGIDNARELIAGAGLLPSRCPYKIYIIDEVHQVTKDAFNALLKTMEEPPPHVKFILCTTEPNKVPPTIQSRCQRFDFRSIPAPRIAAHLRSVLQSEGVTFDEQAIMQVARLANGSMRDGLSLLDRLLAGADGQLDAGVVERLLGLPDASVLHALAGAVADGDPAGALRHGDDLLQRGNTVDQALEALAEHFRALMIASVCGAESDLLERAGDARAAAVAQAERFTPAELVHRIALCEAAARSARSSSSPRAVFDALVVRLAMGAQLVAGAAGTATGSDEKKKPAAEPVADVREEPRSSAPVAAARANEPAPMPSPAVAASHAPPAARSTVAPVAPAATSLDGLWTTIRAAAGKVDAAVIEAVRPVSYDGRSLRVDASAADPSIASLLRERPAMLGEIVQRTAGRRIDVVVEGLVAAPPPRSASTESARTNPLVREAMEIFDATIVGLGDGRGREPR